MQDLFVNIKFNRESLDKYFIRKSILESISKFCVIAEGNLLDIGCGKMPYRDYILKNSKVKNYLGLDIENALVYDKEVKPDFVWDGQNMPFSDNLFDCAFGTEVLEHCFNPHIIISETFRILKPGGIFFYTVPFLWNLHEVPHDHYRFTPFSLDNLMLDSGFVEHKSCALGGWNASLGQMLSLWVKRSKMNSRKRSIIIRFLLPVIRYLYKTDKIPVDFNEGQMITGLFGFARKPFKNNFDSSI